MARFRGTVQGGRGEASRLGHKGLRLHANSWNGSVSVTLFIGKDDKDWANVYLTTGDGHTKSLYNGPLEKFEGTINRQDIPLLTQETNDGCYSTE